MKVDGGSPLEKCGFLDRCQKVPKKGSALVFEYLGGIVGRKIVQSVLRVPEVGKEKGGRVKVFGSDKSVSRGHCA